MNNTNCDGHPKVYHSSQSKAFNFPVYYYLTVFMNWYEQKNMCQHWLSSYLQAQPSRKGIKQFKLAAVTKPIDYSLMDDFAADAMQRILKAESTTMFK